MKASRETWLRLHHFAKVLFVSMGLACWWWTVDMGNKLAGYMRLNVILNFNYLCFLPTYHSPLQECYYYIQIPPLYMNEPTQSKKYHKLKQNLNGIKEDILAPIRCFITPTGSRSRRYYGNQKLTSLHYCLATSRSTLYTTRTHDPVK